MRTSSEHNEESFIIWNKMQKQIGKIIRKILYFNSSYEYNDYLQESFIACHKAILKYNSHINKNGSNGNGDSSSNSKTLKIKFDSEEILISKMRKDVFAFWYVQKKLYKIANSGEVMFDLFDSDGEYIERITNSEYRKKQKHFSEKKYSATSINLFKDLNFFADDDNQDALQNFPDTNTNLDQEF